MSNNNQVYRELLDLLLFVDFIFHIFIETEDTKTNIKIIESHQISYSIATIYKVNTSNAIHRKIDILLMLADERIWETSGVRMWNSCFTKSHVCMKNTPHNTLHRMEVLFLFHLEKLFGYLTRNLPLWIQMLSMCNKKMCSGNTAFQWNCGIFISFHSIYVGLVVVVAYRSSYIDFVSYIAV